MLQCSRGPLLTTVASWPLLAVVVLVLLTFNLQPTCGYAVPPLCDRSWVRPPCWRCGRSIVRSDDCLSASICYDGRVVDEVHCTGGTVYSMQARTCISPSDKRWYDCGQTLPRKPLDLISTHKPTHTPTQRPTHGWDSWPTWGPVTSKRPPPPTVKPPPTVRPPRTRKPAPPTYRPPPPTYRPPPPTYRPPPPTYRPPPPTYRPPTTRRPSSPGPALPGACGIKVEPFIVGGNLADEGEWPWEVSINHYYSNTDSYRHTCGGALISDQWMLTAAHCVSSEEYLYNMVLNAYNLFLISGNEITVGVSKIIQHPEFTDPSEFLNYPNDIALVKFSDPVDLNVVMPICLPEPGLNFANPDDCWVAGWGDTRGTGAKQVLNDLKVEFTNISFCKEAWGEELILPTHMCVGDGSDGACLGDSGGPLMCRKGGRFYIAGITSWGHGSCNLRGFPNVYTRTSDYTDWILRTIESN